MKSTFSTRNAFIDQLRGVSILVVLGMHYNGPSPIPKDLSRILFRNGYYGVGIFLVISGFLIANKVLLDKHKGRSYSIRNFYVQRFGRIFPCLVLVVATLLSLSALGISGFVQDYEAHPVGRLLNYVFTFRFNSYYLTIPNEGLPYPWLILWSLSIEEVFYLTFPILFGLLKKPVLIAMALLAFIIYGPLCRAQLGYVGLYHYFGCFDLIALGCLSALGCHVLRAKVISPKLTVAFRLAGVAVMIFTYLATYSVQNFIIGPSMIAIGAALFLVSTTRNARSDFVGVRRTPLFILELLGRLSYELYLFHLVVLCLLSSYFLPVLLHYNIESRTVSVISLAAFIATCLSFSWLLSRYYSEPLNKRIRRVLESGFGLNDTKALEVVQMLRRADEI